MNITDFLVWLCGGGAVMAVSWAIERWPWFLKQTANVKQWLFYGFCVLISFAAYAVQTYVPVDVLAQLQPWFAMVSGLFGLIFLGTSFHKLDKTNKV